MTDYTRGDVVLVSFIFADETGVKRRPAVIVSSDAYHAGPDEVILVGRMKCELCQLMDEQGARPDAICSDLLEAAKVVGSKV